MNKEAIEFIASIVGSERVSTRRADLEAHSADESHHEPHWPDLMVWPESAEEISQILRWANRRKIPVTPRSGGSSLQGNPIPVRGGIALAMYRMNRILEIRPEDLQVRVQPGVVYDKLNERLAHYGLFFPPAPASSDVATIGGMVANNSSGMHAVKYGTTKDYVLKLEVVLPTGEIITVGSNVFKSSSGYDLVRLFVGSEGTLGVITEITLEEAPTLVMEFHGTPAGIEEEAKYVEEICFDNGCLEFKVAASPQERDRLWEGCKSAHDAIKYSRPGQTTIVGDLVVPISKYPEAVERAYETAVRYETEIITFGHAGDGNLHVEIPFRPNDAASRERAERLNEEIVRYAISVGGTATGEHGVGIGKRKFMKLEHGESLEVMKKIKRLLDPNGIMNPGKIFEEL